MLEYDVVAKRLDAHGSLARCKDAEIILDTDVAADRMPSIRRSCSSRPSPLA